MPHKNWQGQHSWHPLLWFVLIFLLSWHIYQSLPCSVYRPSVEEFVLQQVTQQSYHKHNRFEHIWKWGYFANDPYLQYSFSIGQPVVYHLLCAAQGKIYNTYQGNKFRIVVALSVGLILVRTEEKTCQAYSSLLLPFVIHWTWGINPKISRFPLHVSVTENSIVTQALSKAFLGENLVKRIINISIFLWNNIHW